MPDDFTPPPPVVVPETGIPSEDTKGAYSEEQKSLKARRKQDIKDRKDARRQRRKYAHRIFVLCCSWVCAIFILLMFAGFGSYAHFRFYLSEPVILAAIGSTTVNIIGVFLIVVRFIFHDKKDDPIST